LSFPTSLGVNGFSNMASLISSIVVVVVVVVVDDDDDDMICLTPNEMVVVEGR